VHLLVLNEFFVFGPRPGKDNPVSGLDPVSPVRFVSYLNRRTNTLVKPFIGITSRTQVGTPLNSL
jgi:hypothetical protein